MRKSAANDSFDLERFVVAQAAIFEQALHELQAGQKRSHWMWFIFPQLRGLGRSPTAQFFGIASLDEARAYLAHPHLGPRLVSCTQTVLDLRGRSLNAIFGSPDNMKFRSSMSLFARAACGTTSVFAEALSRYCDGIADERTVALLP